MNDRPDLPNPETAPELFESVLARRVVAYFIDLVLIGMIAGALVVVGLILGLVTFGLAWLSIPIAAPLAVLAYYAVSLGSTRRATYGMAAMDLVLTPTRGLPLDGWKAIVHPIVFWITIWIAWPLLLLGLFTSRRQLLHDLITGTLMLRRSPMERHWREQARAA
jgi:uncharacterized RDD family membrane protein YckC